MGPPGSPSNTPWQKLEDESTGVAYYYNSKTGDSILELLANLHRAGLTIIVVTHEDTIADHCERIVRLRDGQIESDKWMATREV